MTRNLFLLAVACTFIVGVNGCKSTTENNTASAAMEPTADQCKLTLSVTGMM